MTKTYLGILCLILVSISYGQYMVKVEGGTFMMGSNKADPSTYYSASPAHSVTVGSFYLEKFEVTYKKWTTVRAWGLTHGYTDLVAGQNGSDPVGSNNPVTKVKYWDVVKWSNARSEMEGGGCCQVSGGLGSVSVRLSKTWDGRLHCKFHPWRDCLA